MLNFDDVLLLSKARSSFHSSKANSVHTTRSRTSSIHIGSVNIVYGEDYNGREILLGIANSICQICIGATNSLVLFYAIVKTDLHAFLCCIGYHFFVLEAIMSFVPTNNWSYSLNLDQRRFAHMFLQLCGIICCFTGTFIAVFENNDLSSAHSVLGIITTVCTCFTIFGGPLSFFGDNAKIFHIFCSVPTIMCSSVCLLLALIGSNLKRFTGSVVSYLLIATTFIYTIYIVTMISFDFKSRLKPGKSGTWVSFFGQIVNRFPEIVCHVGTTKKVKKRNEDRIPFYNLLYVLNSLTQVCIGALNAIVLTYASLHGDLHIFLCCIGYHFFMMEGILGMNNKKGWSVVLTVRQRRLLHTFLQCCSVVCIMCGTFTVAFSGKSLNSANSFCGFIALSCAISTFLIGPFALFWIFGVTSKFAHITLASPTIIFSTLSLILGLLSPKLQAWSGTGVSVLVCTIALLL